MHILTKYITNATVDNSSTVKIVVKIFVIARKTTNFPYIP